MTFFAAGLQPPTLRPSEMMAAAAAPSEPVIVYTGPTKTGPALIAAVAVDSEKQTPRRGKKGRAAGKKPVATADAKDAKSETRVSVTIDPNAPIKPAAPSTPAPSRTPPLQNPRLQRLNRLPSRQNPKPRQSRPRNLPPRTAPPAKPNRRRSKDRRRTAQLDPILACKIPSFRDTRLRVDPESRSYVFLWIPGSRASPAPRNDGEFCRFWTVDAAIARSRLPLAAALLNTLSKQASRPKNGEIFRGGIPWSASGSSNIRPAYPPTST